jgi:hypothetical protein
MCERYYLCKECYFKWEHKEHDKFVGRERKKDDWVVVERSIYNVNKFNANLEYVKKFGNGGGEMKKLMGENYEKFVSNYIKKMTFL